jgi:CubicO group peptidase (beta-lactamase class C family)
MTERWMKAFGAIFLVLAAMNIACGNARDIRTLGNDPIGTAEVDRIVNELMDEAGVTGLSLAILNDNEPTHLEAYGYRDKGRNEPLTVDSVMLGASFSKAVFAYVVMQLVEEGVLELDRPLHTYLERPLPDYEDFRDLADDDRWRSLTIRHCLSHTTGFPNLRAVNPRGTGKLEIFFEPGTRYAYSGEGVNLLQFVVESVTGTGVEELAARRVFEPLGMTRTSYVWQSRFADDFAVGHDITQWPMEPLRWTHAVAGGSLLTTISDYAQFVAAVMGGRGLDADTRRTMFSPSIRITSERQFPTLQSGTTDRNDAIELSYGLGWGLFTCGHGAAFFKEGHGSGCQNYNVNFIDRRTSIIIMTNSDNGEKIFKDLLERTIGDTCTPWEWEGYVPYSDVEPMSIGVYMYDIIHLHDVGRAIDAYRRIAASPARNGFVFDEDQLNSLGYQMLKEDRLAAAIKLFELNVEEYPESANTHDSLGEVYLIDGQTERAIASYERSLELNPGNRNAAEKRAKLEGDR